MPYYSPPSTGGNDSRLVLAAKPAAQSFTGAATDVTGMVVALAANSSYRIEIFIPITTSTGTAPTLALSFTGPTSPTLVSLRRTQMTSATAVATAVITSFTAFAAAASVANTHHIIEGIVVTGANSGNLQLRATAAGTTPNITIGVGASIIATKTA